MNTIKLNGKERHLKVTFDGIYKLLKKYKDRDMMNDWPEEKTLQFGLDVTWTMLKPNRLGLKPFVFKYVFGKVVDFNDVRNSFDELLQLLYGVSEGRKQKNEVDHQDN